MQVDSGSIPGLGRSPGEGNSYPFQYSCLKKPMDRGTWGGYSPWGLKESDTTERLTLVCSFMCYLSICLVILSTCFERSNIVFLAYTKSAYQLGGLEA